jgi:hypothetical protein
MANKWYELSEKKNMPKKSSPPKKIVTHKERIQKLYEEFGVAKERGRCTGSVNECSINKICDHAGVPKAYLHGHRLQDDNPDKAAYLKLKDEINSFRDKFKSSNDISVEKRELIELQKRYDVLKKSISPMEQELQRSKKMESIASESNNDSMNSKTQMLAKIQQLQEQLEAAPTSTNVVGAMQRRVTRSIVSPDKYRMVAGRYQMGNKKVEQETWTQTYKTLNNLLSRPLKMRLYVLVGLPCSGKTTWAEKADLESDRHPVVFDATNLKEADRARLVASLCQYEDLSKYCVFFDVDMADIRRRNRETRTSDKQITDDDLTIMNQELEKPDPYSEEWIEHLVVVRS